MPQPARPRPSRPSIPTETALVWGLLYDLCCAPAWLVLLLLQRAPLSLGMRPLVRLLHFAAAARMTVVLISLNLLCFAWEVHSWAGGVSEARFLRRFALMPADLLKGNYLPLLTHFFAHASPAHLLGNMLALFVFGRVVERHLLPWRMLLSYLGAALVSTALSLLAQAVLGQNVPTLGASGAVAGMVALGTLFEPFTITFEALLPMPLFLLGWLALLMDLSGLTSARHDGIDHFAHLGGYLSVLLIYAWLDPAQRRLARTGLFLNVATALCGGLLWLSWLQPLLSRTLDLHT